MVVTVIGLMIIAVLAVLVFKKYQSYQQSQRLKAAQLIEEQKRIVEAQRQALGYLPEIKRSEKTENHKELCYDYNSDKELSICWN